MGAVLNPLGAGLSAGFGDAMGEITGYMAGYAVEDIAEQHNSMRAQNLYMARNGDPTTSSCSRSSLSLSSTSRPWLEDWWDIPSGDS